MPKNKCGVLAFSIVAISLTLSGNALAGPRELAAEAFSRKDYKAMVKLVMPSALAGKTWAQDDLATMYAYGYGLPQDNGKALAWYSLSASHGDANAQFNIGYIYLGALSIPKNEPLALKFIVKAGENGDANAREAMLGLCSWDKSVPRVDCHLAFLWAQEAARAGGLKAQTQLNSIYQSTSLEGARPDLSQARQIK